MTLTLLDAFTGNRLDVSSAADGLSVVMSDLSRGPKWDLIDPENPNGRSLAVYGPTMSVPPYPYDYSAWNVSTVKAGGKTLAEWFSTATVPESPFQLFIRPGAGSLTPVDQ